MQDPERVHWIPCMRSKIGFFCDSFLKYFSKSGRETAMSEGNQHTPATLECKCLSDRFCSIITLCQKKGKKKLSEGK